MKKVLLISVMIIFCSAGLLFAGGGWAVGDHVMVNWTGDDYWYPATIVEVDMGDYFVIFDDSDREWVSEERIAPDDLGPGDRVFCNWKGGGTYYPGVIAQRIGDVIKINYDDGDVETTTIGHVRVR